MEKHGYWTVENSKKDCKGEYKLSIKCSQCGETYCLSTTKYRNEYDTEKLKVLECSSVYSLCGKCGAKMDGYVIERNS